MGTWLGLVAGLPYQTVPEYPATAPDTKSAPPRREEALQAWILGGFNACKAATLRGRCEEDVDLVTLFGPT